MAAELKGKNSPAPDATVTGAPPSAQMQDDAVDLFPQKSWGDKYKVGTVSFLRDWFTNYFVNFLISAALTFGFDTSNRGKRFRLWTDKFIEEHTLLNNNAGISRFMIKFMTRTQLLLCGGHALLPIVKWMHDNRKRLEFRIGHKLDALQEFLGFGNAASKQNIEEYHRISSLLSLKRHNLEERDSVPISLTDEDKALLAKHSIDENMRFKEHRLSWWKTIKARLGGVAVTTTLSAGLASASSLSWKQRPWKYARFEAELEEPAGKWLGDKFISRIPVVSWIFKNPAVMTDTVKEGREALTGHQLIGKYFIDDAIFTAGSKFGFDKMESHHRRLEEAELKKAKQAAQEAEVSAERAEKAVSKLESLAQKEEGRQGSQDRILAEGPKDFRARADKREENRLGLQAAL